MKLEVFIKYLRNTDFDRICVRLYDTKTNKTADIGLDRVKDDLFEGNDRFELVAVYFVDV